MNTGLKNNKSLLNILLHTGVWLILFSLPILFFPGELSSFRVVFHMNWIFLFFAGILFYINYFWLVDFFVFEKKTAWFIIINILIIALFTWLNDLVIISWHKPFMDGAPGPPPELGHKPMFKPDRNMIFIRNAATYVVPVIISLMLKVMKRIKKVEAEKKDIEHERLQSELMHLKHQLNPHFFFNSLNNIYALVDISPEKSKEAIHRMAKLIRYLLYETDRPLVSLSQEIEFLKQYVEIMKLRLTEKTNLSASFPNDKANPDIAPLLFLPLVENAFKHGITSTHSEIAIELKLQNKTIIFTTQNAYNPTDNERNQAGIGIENLKKRLELLYSGQYEYKTSIENGIFHTFLSIKLN
ncbi:MAG TPA: histidine kinase [Bacteroidales bacterium]|nr:histidine kinase [Bacteroidales bacterium]HPI29977.1 histidine kinase [Bacteroidales bacterium]HQN16496.1 histidine kinase [Bacteroidales bacterium]